MYSGQFCQHCGAGRRSDADADGVGETEARSAN
jgi:hypothetical protein